MLLNLSSDKSVDFKNLDKMYFENKGIKKGDVIDYYVKIAPLLLPHLHNRPFSMIHFPDADVEKSFYQKQKPDGAPIWLETVKIESKARGHIEWCLVNDLPSLLYMVNRSVLEMHAWFSRIESLNNPDIAVMDLDPSGKSTIKEAVIIANAFRENLEKFNLYSMPKSSGSRGIHIFIPLKNKYTYAQVQEFLQYICSDILKKHSDICTNERLIKNRGDRIYLDAVQCAKGKTLAMPYSMRVKAGATVSAPLLWEEVNSKLDPKKFDINSIFKRLETLGDLSKDLYNKKQSLPVLH